MLCSALPRRARVGKVPQGALLGADDGLPTGLGGVRAWGSQCEPLSVRGAAAASVSDEQ